jgi:hypothetical protein
MTESIYLQLLVSGELMANSGALGRGCEQRTGEDKFTAFPLRAFATWGMSPCADSDSLRRAPVRSGLALWGVPFRPVYSCPPASERLVS